LHAEAILDQKTNQLLTVHQGNGQRRTSNSQRPTFNVQRNDEGQGLF